MCRRMNVGVSAVSVIEKIRGLLVYLLEQRTKLAKHTGKICTQQLRGVDPTKHTGKQQVKGIDYCVVLCFHHQIIAASHVTQEIPYHRFHL